MKLEEAKKYSEIMIKTFDTKCPNVNVRNANCLKVEVIETVLQALENSISKDKVKEKIELIDLKINNLKTEINKTLRENEEAGTETEIDINEQYICNMEIELERLENTQKVLQELLEDK